MAQRSRFDELHDQYQAINTTKAGTRYERLAAVVFAALDRDGIVIHDLKVVGEVTGVKHQIDVVIEKNGALKRILVECKDFDIAGDDVGVGIVRDLQGVISDVKPDEAWIITCNGFTREAKRFAKGFGIRLATLREFAAEDWENRVRTIVVNIDIVHVHEERPDVQMKMADEDAAVVLPALSGGYSKDNETAHVFDGQRTVGLGDYLNSVARRVPVDFVGDKYHEGNAFDGTISLPDGSTFPIQGIGVSFKVTRDSITMKIEAEQSAARLLMSDADGLDFVLWEDALAGYKIDADSGEVTLADDALQKKLVTTIIGPVKLEEALKQVTLQAKQEN